MLNWVKQYAGVAPATFVIGFFMLLPILIVVLYSFLDANPYGGVRWNFTFDAYTKIIYERDLFDEMSFNSAYLKIIFRSVWIAIVTVVACLLVGFPVAYYMGIIYQSAILLVATYGTLL